MAEQAKILVAEAEENTDNAAKDKMPTVSGARSLCERHGTTGSRIVRSGGRHGRRTWGGRRRTSRRQLAMATQLGNGSYAMQDGHKAALSVDEAESFMDAAAPGTSEEDELAAQGHLATTYHQLGRDEAALSDATRQPLRTFGAQRAENVQ